MKLLDKWVIVADPALIATELSDAFQDVSQISY
jgi:hypothetical protein